MSEFEKKIIQFKEQLNNSRNIKELLSINSEIFGKNGTRLFPRCPLAPETSARFGVVIIFCF